ncbi:MAG: S41 family peptidase [Pseudomonadota bacterium]
MRARLASIAAGLAAAASTAAIAGVEGYYSYPDAHGDTLVFASEGDLWRASVEGGDAVRLTTHPEPETRPFISPDGASVVFMGNYDGEGEAYVVPLAGGRPKQITFEGGRLRVEGWSPDGRVLIASYNEPGNNAVVLRLVDPETLEAETLPLWRATAGAFSGDGKTFYFTRRGLSESNDNALLYRGGAMAELWSWRIGSKREATQLADDFGAPIRSPMVHGNRVYFVSDKSGADAIWSMARSGRDIQQHTENGEFQIRRPNMADGKILYQRGADIYVFDIEAEEEAKIDLSLVSDRDYTRKRWLDDPLDYLDAAIMGGAGEAVALTARGDVALGFTGERRRVDFEIPKGARARVATPGPKGDWVYLVIDQNRRGEIWRLPADGRGEAEQLTVGSDAPIWEIVPSPDGSRLVYDDKKGRLWSLDLESQEKTLLVQNETGDDSPFTGISWSKHGRYLTYAEYGAADVNDVFIHDTETGERARVDSAKYAGYSPAFSADGEWLFFLSDRAFSPTPGSPWGDRNMGPAFINRTKIYATALTEDAEWPFAPKDELAAKEDEDENGEDEEADTEEKSDENAEDASEDEEKKDEDEKDVEIVFDGIAGRLWEVPAERGDYWGLGANGSHLYVLQYGDDQTDLKSIKIDATDAEMKTFASNVRGYSLSDDGEKLFYRSNGMMAIVPAGASAPDDLSDHKIRVGDWKLPVDPQVEWRQMVYDAWRMHRDYSFDPAMRGVDWEAVLERYAPLVARVGHRTELDDLLAQMSANLGILHSQIARGETPQDEEVGDAAFLGAKFEAVDNGLRVATIFAGESDLIDRRGPLTEPGVDVREGDVLIAVDGTPVSTQAGLHAALNQKAGQQVRLDLLRDGEEVSEIVEPTGSDFWLMYDHWVEGRRDYVRSETDNRFGYMHLRAMGGRDVASFARDYYEHDGKDGLIIDVRGNWGGNVDSWLLGFLSRRAWAFWMSPNGGEPYVNMQRAFRGHIVVLIDEGTYSDGETFTAGFKALELGDVIGQQTAGAGIWLSGRNNLVDGGRARIAEFPQFGLDGRWLIEARGVSPDIEVDNLPYATFKGQDAQLDAAISHLEKRLKEDPIPELKAKPLPPFGQWGQDVE